MRSHARIMVVLATVLASAGCYVHARARTGMFVVYEEPPPPRVIVPGPAPYAGAIWVEGYWHWSGASWVWMEGRWIAPRPGYLYVRPRWVRQGSGWIYVRGRWHAHASPVYVRQPRSRVYVRQPAPRPSVRVAPARRYQGVRRR